MTCSYEGVAVSCQRGPGRTEKLPLTRRVFPPSSSSPVVTVVDQRVWDVELLPKLADEVHPAGVSISGPPRVRTELLVRRLSVNVNELVQKFFQVTLTEGRVVNTCRSLPKVHSFVWVIAIE